MSATTRWVEYEISATGSAGDGGTEGLGTRGYAPADGASDTDTFNIGTGNNRLHLSIDGDGGYITLASGTNLDPRFLARDITEKLHNLGKAIDGYNYAQCVWENGKLMLYSGSLGSSSSVSVVSGTNTAHLELGWGTSTPVGGNATTNDYNSGGVTISGTYNGFFDETYRIVINKENPIQTPSKGGSNSYTGTIATGGAFNYTSSAITYTLNIDITNGTTMGGGTGNVPKLSWTTSPSVDDGGPVELLYPEYWYQLGTKGLMVKFTDAVFNSCPPGTPAWTIVCNQIQYAEGSNPTVGAGTAMYYYSSTRGDDAASSITCQDDSLTQLGTRGVYMKFVGTPADTFTAGDEFYVVCRPPQPMSYDLTNVNYGNVTVSTESPVKAVMFEIVSGAVEISTVKFGLQSHGTFEHHNENNSDTYFRFGTVGPGQNAGASPINSLEWRQNVAASDIASDTPPAYLYATKENLAVVSDADDSETIGSSGYMGMTSDPIFINVRLGASEIGANSLINQRVYFDYS